MIQKIKDEEENKYLKQQFSQEVEVLQMIHSKHVIKVIKAYKSQSRHYLITELCNSGDLSTLMDVRRHLSEDEARIILKQIVIGLRDINKGKVIHRDMKLANVLLHFPNEDLLAQRKDERK